MYHANNLLCLLYLLNSPHLHSIAIFLFNLVEMVSPPVVPSIIVILSNLQYFP
uniref:Uncharacterized protein n=1 Tax=Arundo donax TaxID=35708 RepID=A0A0A9CAN5_ARUDO